MTDKYTKVIVSNVDKHTTEQDIRDAFEVYGPIKQILTRGDSLMVEFEDYRDAHDALRMNGRRVDGKDINVEIMKGVKISDANRDKIIDKLKVAIEQSEIPINHYEGKMVYNEADEYSYKIIFDKFYDPNKKVGAISVKHGIENEDSTIDNKEQILDIIVNDEYYCQEIGKGMSDFVIEQDDYFLEFSTSVILKYDYKSLGNNAKVLKSQEHQVRNNVNMFTIDIGFFFVIYDNETYYKMDSIGYQKLRLAQLCDATSRYKKDELYDWAEKLGIKSRNSSTLCRRIKRKIQEAVNRIVNRYIDNTFNSNKLYSNDDAESSS